jgi:Leucine-rich repeat (LRR) protein
MYHSIFVLLNFLLLVSDASSTLSTYDALKDLYYATNGPSWTWSSSIGGVPWNFSAAASTIPVCDQNWQGVICAPNKNVIGLSLQSNGMYGQLPSTISSLVYLEYLSLNDNFLIGSIPAALGNLTMLKQLELTSTLLSAPIPSSLGYLQQLIQLQLQGNSFHGPVPSSLGNLIRLEVLNLDSNFLTGSIPSTLGNLRELEFLEISFSSLTGSIPPSIGSLTKLFRLDFDNNFIVGEIPATLDHFPLIRYLDFSENLISGTIPTFFCDYRDFWYFNLYQNFFNGTIPNCMGNLTALQFLILFDNQLSGTLPQSLGNLSVLLQFFAQQNLLTGSIPESFDNLYALTNLFLYENKLTGKIPNFQNCYNMSIFDVDANLLTGPIPFGLQNKSLLQNLILSDNFLTGTISESFESVYDLFLNSNYFTGHLPEIWFSNISKLNQLSVAENHLSGEFPSSWPSSLQDASFAGNRFNGTLAEYLFSRTPSISYLDFSSNLLGGTLHSYFFNGTVRYLFLSHNEFTGIVPYAEASSPSVLQYISFSRNYIEGSLPRSVLNLSELTSWIGADNYLTGPMDDLFSTQFKLNEIVLTNNLLTGSLGTVMEASSSSSLIINLAYNLLSGTLPETLLRRGQLQALIVSVNCLSGTISDLICANTGLTEVLLDGMHIADLCEQFVLPRFLWEPAVIDGVVAESDSFGGTIPSCLFGLSQLEYLHLSGNLMSGQILSDISQWNATSLSGLDLSHNALTGTVPLQIWTHRNLVELDLSFNRLTGTIPSGDESLILANYTSSNYSSVYLNVNRFSGPLPSTWKMVGLVNVLDGNMFSCESIRSSQASNEPIHDPTSRHYECGSYNTDIALLAFGVFSVALIVLIFFWRVAIQYCRVSDRFLSLSYFTRFVATWFQLTHDSVLLAAHQAFVYRLLVGTFIFICIGLPLYGGLSVKYATHTYSYVWVASMTFLQGQVPAYILLVFLICFGWGLLWYGYQQTISINKRTIVISLHTRSIPSSTSVSTSVFIPNVKGNISSGSSAIFLFGLIMLAVVNATIVLIINGIYVYFSGLNLPPIQQSASFIAISVFKLMWNSVILMSVFATFRWFASKKLLTNDTTNDGSDGYLLPTWMINAIQSVELISGTLNNVLAPLLAEVFVSAQCFKYALTSPNSITSTVTGGLCLWAFGNSLNSSTPIICGRTESSVVAEYSDDGYGDIIIFHILETFSNGESSTITYIPGFSYSFQCSSSLLATFVVVFIIRYLLSSFVKPYWWFIIQRMHTYGVRRYGPDSWFARICSKFLPLLLRIVDLPNTTGTSATSAEIQTNLELDKIVLYNQGLLRSFLSKQQPMQCVNTLYVRVISDMAVLLSFGVQFPPLAFVVALSIIVDVISWQFMVSRLFDLHASIQQQLQHLRGSDLEITHAERLELNATSLQSLYELLGRFLQELVANFHDFYRRVYTMGIQFCLMCAAVLWGFALFDILGNAVGGTKAVWIFVVMILAPLLWIVGQWLLATLSVCTKISRVTSDVDMKNSVSSEDHIPAVFGHENSSSIELVVVRNPLPSRKISFDDLMQ